MWLNVQNSPECFLDVLTSSSSSVTSRGVPQDYDELEKERAAASGYIRSLSCRLTLISKIQTKDLKAPQLIQNQRESDGGSNSSSIPVATIGELEFAFKCLSRAGRAILNHSLSRDLSSLPELCDPLAAYSTLSLALEVWKGIEQIQLAYKDQGEKCLFIDEVFEVMLSLPDCAALIFGSYVHRDYDTVEAVKVISLVDELKRLEEFVNKQVSGGGSALNKDLKMIQHYFPSLARISYKVSKIVTVNIINNPKS